MCARTYVCAYQGMSARAFSVHIHIGEHMSETMLLLMHVLSTNAARDLRGQQRIL